MLMTNSDAYTRALFKTNIPQKKTKINILQKSSPRVGAPEFFYWYTWEMTIGTHNGKFHSDDVFSVALLTTLYPDAKVVRSRDLDVLKDLDIVLDVGGEYDVSAKRFDHHQTGGAGERPNGIRYSALGLIWQAYGLEFCGGNSQVHARLFEGFISSFDAYDNGQSTYTITTPEARVIELQDLFDTYLNPTIDEPAELQDYDKAFDEAVVLAQKILTRVVKRETANVAAEEYFYNTWQASPDKRYVVLERMARAGDKAADMPELLYYVYQAPNKNWNVQAMTVERGSYTPKQPFPTQWAGLNNEQLANKTGVADAVFCHNNLHLCGARSKEGAIALLQLALDPVKTV